MKEKIKQKKGFTIIELMAVLIIIAVLATLVITSVTGYKEKSTEEYINSLKKQVELAARDYYSNNPHELPRGQVEGNEKIYSTSVTTKELLKYNHFTNELVDENGNDCSNDSYVIVNNTNGIYTYEPCLICNGKVLNETNYCKINGNVVVNDFPYCSVSVETANQNVKKLVVYTNSTSGVIESNIVAASDGNYYVYKPGTYNFTVQNSMGETATCGVTIYMEEDNAKPSCSTSVVSSTNSSYKVKFSWSDGISLKSVTNPTDGSVYKNDYVCSFEEYSVSGAADFTFTRTTTDKTYTMTVTDCNGNADTCSITVPKKTSWSGGGSGGSDICIGSGCNDEEEEEDTGCTTVCYAGKTSDYDQSTCRYYQCSDDGCSGWWVKDPNCTVEEEEVNPPTGCFLEGTKVLTSNGYKNIEDIEIGEYVLSYNLKKQKQEYNKVDYKFIHKNNSDRLYEIVVDGKVIKVTEHHGIYVRNGYKLELKAAMDVKVGDVIIDKDNNEHIVSFINSYDRIGTVYNLSVENNHNYYVYEESYLVHNQTQEEYCDENPYDPKCQ